jgi:hypothetical protein
MSVPAYTIAEWRPPRRLLPCDMAHRRHLQSANLRMKRAIGPAFDMLLKSTR